MKIAVLMCVYLGDDPQNFKDAIDSVFRDSLDEKFFINLYLHVDGKLSEEHESILGNNNIHKVIRSENNVGLAAGLNKLASHLENEDYYFRMDADDLVVPGRFRKQIDFMEANPNVELSGGAIQEFIHDPSNIIFHREYPIEQHRIYDAMFKVCPFAHVTVCFRKGFFSKYGMYPIEYPLNEDIAYWIKLKGRGFTCANIKDTLVSVRMDGAYERRSVGKMIPEFKVYFAHNVENRKFPIYPVLRLFMRLLPSRLTKLLYTSNLRGRFSG